MTLTLLRLEHSATECVGVLLCDGKIFCVTLEPEPPIIPTGQFDLSRTRFHRGGYDTYEVTHVPNHDRILIHVGNVAHETDGCILVGQYADYLGQARAVRNSALTFGKLMPLLENSTNNLLVVREAGL